MDEPTTFTPSATAASTVRRAWKAVSAIAAVLLLVATGFLLSLRPGQKKASLVKPSRIEFAPLRDYEPDLDPDLFEDAPFLGAVVGHLRGEGEARGEKASILIGSTLSFEQPAPAFRCVLDCRDWKGSKFAVTGYAFRRHDGQPLGVFEAIPVDDIEGRTIFLVPPCDKGDVLFVVLRLTRLEGDDPLDDPARVVSLRVRE